MAIKELAVKGFRPGIPGWIVPNARKVILDCLEQQLEKRPSFTEI
jgi:hypothetical protein